MKSRGRVKTRCGIAAAIAAALTCILLSSPPPAFALCTPTIYDVTTQADETTPNDGLLSLREAVNDANADGNLCDTIELPDGVYPITAAQGGAIQITRAGFVNVQPQTASSTARNLVIDGGGSNALFHVTATAKSAHIERITLTRGTDALVNEGGASLKGVTVAGNTAPAGFGGGIYNGAGAQLQVSRSTISNNAAGAAHGPAGGGIYNEGRLEVYDSTISGNTVSGNEAVGGGIYNSGEVFLTNVTVDRNTAAGAEAIAGDIDTTSTAKTITIDSLFAGGLPEGCNSPLTPGGGDHSMSSDTTCLPLPQDPKLGPLQNNGGGTDTEMLLSGSPAIDVVSPPCSFDQRGVAQPQGTKCDVGAYELVQSADLGVSGSASENSVSQGSEVAFTFSVASTAPTFDASLANDAVQPTLTDVLPAGLQFLSGSPGCSANGQTVTCNPDPLADNAGPTGVTITARAVGVGTISNIATVSSPRPDTNPFDDSATATVTSNAAQPMAPPLGQPPPVALSAVSQSARTWVEGSVLARITATKALPVGTTFSFTLNEAASVTFAFTAPARGRRVGKACVAPTSTNRHKPSCIRTLLAGTLKFTAHTAVNRVRFQGLISRRQKLNPGGYMLTITATAPGQQPVSSMLHFTIARTRAHTRHN